MRRASVSFLAIITLVGLVFGGFLISSPNKTTNPETVDTSLLYRTGSPIKGNGNAPIKITIFSDYLCPYCKDAHAVINNILSSNSQDVAIYYRNLIIHENAEIFTRAALASNKQGKFAQFDNILFEREIESTEDAIINIAKEIGLNIDNFKSDLNSSDTNNIITQDEQDATSLQIRGTPTIFLNDQRVEDFRTLPDLIKDMV